MLLVLAVLLVVAVVAIIVQVQHNGHITVKAQLQQDLALAKQELIQLRQKVESAQLSVSMSGAKLLSVRETPTIQPLTTGTLPPPVNVVS